MKKRHVIDHEQGDIDALGDGDEEGISSGDSAASSVSGRRKKRNYANFTTQQENAALEYLKSNQIIYNSKADDYRNNQMKEDCWLEMKRVTGAEVDKCKLWYKSSRTAAVRIINKATKSGSGAFDEDTLTDREKFLYNQWSFIRKHYYPHKSKVPKGVSMKKNIKKHSLIVS